jgi:hypothetical protein
MNAFRDEMKDARAFDERTNKFVPSRACVSEEDQRAHIQERADEIYGPSAHVDGQEDFDDFEWPDELMILGIDVDNAEEGTTSTTTSSTSTTESETPPTDSEDDDAWPMELLVQSNHHDRDIVVI